MSTPEPLPPYSEVVLGTAPWCLEAGKVFHDKTADKVFEMFFRGGGGFWEIDSLAWVGAPAFRYYIRPVIRYCLTLGHVHDPQDGETEDPDSIDAVAGILSYG